MATQSPPRQRDRRFSVSSPSKAYVEFSQGRRDWHLPLIDLSIGGISFASEGPVKGLAPECRLEAVVHIGDCEISGYVILRHVTEQADAAFHYGGVFYPGEEGEMLKLNGVLAGIDAITSR